MVSPDSQRVEALRAAALTTAGRFAGPRRRRAVRGLARLRTPAATRALAEVFVADPDGPVGGIAADALRGSSDPAGLDAVCEVAIRTGDRRLQALVEAAGHLPTRPERRALWLFLADRFDDAAELDFDGDLLRAAFMEADAELRRRMAARVRESGRADWFGALTLVNDSARLDRLSEDGWELAVEALAEAGHWEPLWRLAQRAPLPWAARILRLIAEGGWRPESEADRAGFDCQRELAERCRSPLSASAWFGRSQILAKDLDFPMGYALNETGLFASSQRFGPSKALLWRLPSGEAIGTFDALGVSGARESVAIASDGSAIAVGGFERVSLFAVSTGTETMQLKAPENAGYVQAVAFTPDRELLVGADDNARVWLWRLASGKLWRGWAISSGSPSIAMTPDGRILAAGAGDRMFHLKGRHDKVHLWHLPSGRAAGTVTVGEPGVRSLKITPDGKRLVTVGVDGTTGIWSLPSGKLEATMPYKADLAYVEMSADGSLLAGLNPDMTAIEVRHLRSGAVATRIDLGGCGEGMSDGRFALSADNRLLAGADAVQGCVDLWHLPTGASAGRILDEPEVEYLAFAPQGALIAGVNGGVRMWRPEPALAGGSPVSEVTLAEAERLRRGKHAAADGPWLDLLVALVEWRHRNDIEVADGDALRPPRPTDIEATG